MKLLTNVDRREAPYDPKQKRKAKLLLFSIMHAVPFLFLIVRGRQVTARAKIIVAQVVPIPETTLIGDAVSSKNR